MIVHKIAIHLKTDKLGIVTNTYCNYDDQHKKIEQTYT